MKINSLLIYILAAISSVCFGQTQPLEFAPTLAGNYGELRPNHFHAGLDFKTQQTIGHPVHSFADGYVERVGINALGYGLVVYITHPQIERMTVYGHLSDFGDKIWKKLKERQIAEELNNADVTFAPDEIPVKADEVFAKSGNTGSSGGPHVHFEVRGLMSAPGADDEKWYDPMPYFEGKIKDTTAPKILNLYIYEQPNTAFTSHRQILNRTTNAWGKVAFALRTYDYMDGQTNKYGVKRLKLFCDDKLIYNWNQEYFQYHEQRFTNSVIDYEEWIANKAMIMKSYIEPNNHLNMIDHTIGDGTIEIDEERPYKLRYELEDAHGNKTSLSFVVNGVKQEAKAQATKGMLAKADKDFRIDSLGCILTIPKGNLYTDADIEFKVDSINSTRNLTPVYRIGRSTIPLHGFCELKITLPDSITSGENLYVANLEGGTHKIEFLGSYTIPFGNTILSPLAKVKVREFGSYVVRKDTIGPEITIVGRPNLNTITLRIIDAESGTAGWKVYVDGKFVPFDKDNRGRVIGNPSRYGIPAGRHTVEIEAYDLVGNKSFKTLKI